jgi:hypothetical protein
LDSLAPGLNLQFVNFTIDAGVTLTVPSGAVIRCTGTFTNNGTIVVSYGERTNGQFASPGAGVSHAPAGNGGNSYDNSRNLPGASGGVGLSEAEATLLVTTARGGGAGGGLYDPWISNPGGNGGGVLTILAQTAIINSSTGVIHADGETATFIASGGGAGGVVLLASPGSITQAGQITARGGNGTTTGLAFNAGAGGGGGGGIVHLLAPTITTTGGTVDVSGGNGQAGAAGSSGSRTSGAGGGACGGNGGPGGGITADPGNEFSASGNGGAGYSLQSTVDPTALF